MITSKIKTKTDLTLSPISGGRAVHTYKHTVEVSATYTHEIERGQNFHSLSALIFGTEEYWWVLLDINNVQDSFSIPIGSKIKLVDGLAANGGKNIF